MEVRGAVRGPGDGSAEGKPRTSPQVVAPAATTRLTTAAWGSVCGGGMANDAMTGIVRDEDLKAGVEKGESMHFEVKAGRGLQTGRGSSNQ